MSDPFAGVGRLLLIGAGNMGGAMLARWVEAGLPPERVTVVSPSLRAMPAGVWVVAAIPDVDAGAAFDTVVLALKPQQIGALRDGALTGHAPRLLMSVLAGVEVATLASLCAAGAVVRAMPNLPVAIGRGVTALYADRAAAQACGVAEALARPLGHVEWIADERQFDAVTALAGCGPGFLFRYIDALAAAGAAIGLPAGQAARLAMATVEGSAIMAAASAATPAALADRVASKGGSTREGLDVLDADGALVTLLTATLTASARRNREMAAAARD